MRSVPDQLPLAFESTPAVEVRISRVRAWAPGRAALLECGCSIVRPFSSRPAAVAHECHSKIDPQPDRK